MLIDVGIFDEEKITPQRLPLQKDSDTKFQAIVIVGWSQMCCFEDDDTDRGHYELGLYQIGILLRSISTSR